MVLNKYLLSFVLAMIIEFTGWVTLMFAVRPRSKGTKFFAEITRDEWLALMLAILTGVLGWVNIMFFR